MRNIYLHGRLATEFGPHFELDVVTAGEAFRALSVNFKNFISVIAEGEWMVIRGDEINGLCLEETDINAFKLGQADLHFVPAAAGAKRGGPIKIILGVALIGAAVFFSGGTLGAAVGAGLLSGVTYGNLAMLGLALSVAGVASMLAPKDHAKKDTANDSSFGLSAAQAYEQGNPIPLVYGETMADSFVISSGLTVDPLIPGVVPIDLNTGPLNGDSGQT